MWKYVKAAFKTRWNLFAIVGGIGISLLSNRPEIGLSLVAAAEVAWLGFAASQPRFRQYTDIQEHQQLKQDDIQTAAVRLRRMLTSLPRGSRRRFDQLQRQCEELKKVSGQHQHVHETDESDQTVFDVRWEGLDRLLWLFVKLLYTENSLNRFFETTSLDHIEKEIADVSAQLEDEKQRPHDPSSNRLIATLEDNLATCRARKTNFKRAKDSYELVKAEQERLENKIRSLAEIGISKRDPILLSDEVDIAAESIHHTEKTLNRLEFVTGFSTIAEETVPQIVRRRQVSQAR